MCLEFASFFHFMYVFVSVRRDVYGVCSSACFDKCKILHLEEVLKLKGIDSCDVLSFETHTWKSLWISFGSLGLKNSSETSQNAKC